MAIVVKHAEHFHGDTSAAATPQALADRRDLTFIAVERTRMPMVVTDPRLPDNPIVMANEAFLSFTGYSVAEVINQNCRFLQGRDTDPQAIDAVRNAIADEETITIEILNYRKDGTSFWNELHISPIHDDNGQLIYFFASQLDVSERRRMHDLEASEHLMLREIEHRAKNALALVQGIVRLSHADTVDEFSNRVQGRVDALANAHTVLAEARWCGVPLDMLLRAETVSFDGDRVKFDGPPVEIPAAQVQSLALVLHEVISNTARHGALSTDEGTLSMRWRAADGWVRLELSDTGGPPPPNDRYPGFGMKIIDAIVRRQLRGSVAFDWRPDGLTSVLELPEEAVA